MEDQPRTIVVIRHSKAEQVGPSDMERELTSRGAADADAAGRWLRELGLRPDHVLVSSATRTRQTWDALARATGWDAEPAYDSGLYAAGPETALDLVRETPDSAHTLVVVGHNPTMAYLAQLLDDGEGDPEASTEMVSGFPTSAVAVFEYDGTWRTLDEGDARVVAFHVGRG